MNIEDEMTDRIIAAIDAVDGAHPAVPMGLQNSRWLPWNAGRAAVDLGETVVEIRVVATTLPLPPLLGKLDAAVRPVLAASRWADAVLRVHVVDLHVDAVGSHRDPDHSPGP
ncbi:hypothetical protein NN3_18540 [Nocardia neocaledoniensis NBRC 108232]|uniref:Uncharacterized protein n=1 Tax=Nocardia neocaledoniensis TaxID=236511 RepID=A0A317N580_9NOCA|nr:hypothetical protein [Nocardia neocaledoniensis]PWV70426.1 hypothetical protein DFR69_113139 [Nocardia neocaledoniensis]GEM30847.1 hypothetical protein NN3_18540 [Nocardia neocaledoniensis NBRC 108232]